MASTTNIAQPYSASSATAANTTNVPHIFVSHSAVDNAFGLRLTADLRVALGGDADAVWYDAARGLQGGDAWLKRIVAELTSRPVFVILLSRAAMSSKWVLDELDLAWTQKNSAEGKVIIPVLVEPCEAPFYLAVLQFVSFVPPRPYEEALAELWRAIHSSQRRAAPMEHASTIPLGLPFEEEFLLAPQRFVGRSKELAWVLERLGAGGATAILALGGMGGIGKTALAAMAIRELRRAMKFPDGIAVVLCQELTDPADVLARVLTRFDPYRKAPQEATLADLDRKARDTLKGKRALVVLDNIEPRLPITDVVAPLRTAGLTLLLTARQALPPEVVPADASKILDLLPSEEALELFAWAFGREHSDALSPAEYAAATRIVEVLGRHTLAVRLAGAYAASARRDLAALATELDHDPLETPIRDTPRGVALILSRSTAALSEGGRQLFAGLVAFSSARMGRRAALALAAHLGQASGQASVDLLVQRALVEAYVSQELPADSDRERLRLHPLLRAFAADLFARWAEEEREMAKLAVARYFAAYAEVNQARVAALTADESNATGALEWALAHGRPELVVSLSHGLRRFWLERARWRDGARFLALAVEMAAANVDAGENHQAKRHASDLLLTYGQILFYLGRMDAGTAELKRSLLGYRDVNDRNGEAAVLSELGEAALRGRATLRQKTTYSKL
ncbi:MAG TPA: TIR domain-containing protein [Ktedonobacterales bacterium]